MTPDEVLNEAERVFASGDVMGAERVLARLWSDTTHAPASVLHLLGVIHFRTNDFPGAERFLRRAIKAAPAEALHQRARHHAALAELLMLAGHYAHALDSYAEAMRLDPNLPMIKMAYGHAAFRAGRYEEAERIAKVMLERRPTASAWDMLSCALRELGKHNDAVAASNSALELDPGNLRLLHSRAAAWTFLGKDSEALEVLEPAAETFPAPMTWYFRSRALVNLRRYDEAAAVLEDGIRRWPRNERLRAASDELKKAH